MRKGVTHKDLSYLAHEWRDRMQSDSVTSADREALQRWLDEDLSHEEAYDRAVTYWAALDHLRMEDIDAELRPPGLAHQAGGLLTGVLGWIRQPFARAMAAASFIALLAISVWTFMVSEETTAPTVAETVAEFSTTVGQTRSVTLADGSTAMLGPKTHITVRFSENARSIAFGNGAALFNVTSDPSRPFQVTAGALAATALGTQFDVRAAGGTYRVAVAEGRVEVSYPSSANGASIGGQQIERLGAGQEVTATVQAGLSAPRQVALKDIASWTDNRLVYFSASLSEVIADVNRYSSVPVKLAFEDVELAKQRVTGSFDAGEIDRMLRLITLAFPVEIDRNDKSVILIRPLTSTED
ncbi:MAG: FecR domain-containing protein [Pseudomonadota bacterium]